MTSGPPPAAEDLANAQARLAGRSLDVRYGAVQVVTGVDFMVAGGETVGIVGPNGAGKTTLLNALSGTVKPSSGSVHLLGEDVTRAGPAQRCRAGISRAFQVPRPFGGMTVLENVLVGAAYGGGLGRKERLAAAIEVLELCDLATLANRRAESLGLLHRKRLELARALATAPKVLLLDEIGAGLTDAEADELVATINALKATGVSIVWIEHIVHVLLRVIDRLVAMDAGRVIADGDPRSVLADARVVDAYLGGARS